MTRVSVTATAQRQLKALRGKRARAARTAIEELLARGCAAAGYRLAGAPLDHICCLHLYGDDRLLTAWPGAGDAVVLLVGPHDRGPLDIYHALLDALEIEMPEAERSKPPCCGPGTPPPVDKAAVETVVDAVRALRKRRAA